MRAIAVGISAANSSLAPDGLPWPKGYFDFPLKQNFDEAVALYGLRPSYYYRGRPAYTPEETGRPEFKVKAPEEPVELQEQWRKEWAEWEASEKSEGAQ